MTVFHGTLVEPGKYNSIRQPKEKQGLSLPSRGSHLHKHPKPPDLLAPTETSYPFQGERFNSNYASSHEIGPNQQEKLLP